MAMRAQCRAAAAAALGRDPPDSMLDEITKGLAYSMRSLARQDPAAWQSATQAQRVRLAVKNIVSEIESKATKAKQRIQLQAARVTRAHQEFSSLLRFKKGATTLKVPAQHALIDYLDRVNNRVDAVAPQYFKQVLDGMNQLSPNFLGFFTNRKFLSDFAHEVYAPGSTKNIAASKFAKQWLDTVEQMRVRFNDAGGDTGKLAYGYLPQKWDVGLVREAFGRDGGDKFAQYFLNRVDRRQYVNEDGSLMNDTETSKFLKEAFSTIVSDGAEKRELGQVRKNSRITRFSQTRQLHLRDAQTYLDTMSKFANATPFDMIKNHINGMGREIGLAEEMGPQAEATFRYLHDLAKRLDGDEVKRLAGFITPQHVWDAVNGSVNRTDHPTVAGLAQAYRNLKAGTLFGRILLTQLTDFHGMAMTARTNQMPVFRMYSNLIKEFGSKSKTEAYKQGIGIDHLMGDLSRYAGDISRIGWTGRYADLTIRASGTHALQGFLDRVFQISHMQDLVGKVKTPWAKLDAFTQMRLTRQGVRATDWDTWGKAVPEKWRGKVDTLTPEAVLNAPGVTDEARSDAAKGLLGFLKNESKTAVHQGSNLTTRAGTALSQGRGAVGRELLQTGLFAKSYVISYMMRHFNRMMLSPTVIGRAGYIANMMVGMTVLGAISEQLYSLAKGQNPNMNNAHFWINAITRGGGMSLIGDLFKLGSEGGDRGAELNPAFFFGPLPGDVATTWSTAVRAAQATGAFGEAQAQQGRKYLPQLAYKEGKAFIPQPLMNEWYTKAAFDHFLFNRLQDWLNPGYLQRMKQRAAKEGTTDWWPPDSATPTRLPSLTGGTR